MKKISNIKCCCIIIIRVTGPAAPAALVAPAPLCTTEHFMKTLFSFVHSCKRVNKIYLYIQIEKVVTYKNDRWDSRESYKNLFFDSINRNLNPSSLPFIPTGESPKNPDFLSRSPITILFNSIIHGHSGPPDWNNPDKRMGILRGLNSLD